MHCVVHCAMHSVMHHVMHHVTRAWPSVRSTALCMAAGVATESSSASVRSAAALGGGGWSTRSRRAATSSGGPPSLGITCHCPASRCSWLRLQAVPSRSAAAAGSASVAAGGAPHCGSEGTAAVAGSSLTFAPSKTSSARKHSDGRGRALGCAPGCEQALIAARKSEGEASVRSASSLSSSAARATW